MPFVSITKPTQGDPTKKTLADAIIDNLEDLNSRLAGVSLGVQNGSFEEDTDSDGIPDKWARTLYTGGSFTRDNTDQQHGLYSAKFTSPGGVGNGGGYLESTDFFSVSPNRPIEVLWEMKSSVVDVSNKVEITWYTSAQVSISTTALYDEAADNPTSWTGKSAVATPPATARYAKLRITGGHTSSTNAGDTWFDNVQVRLNAAVSVTEQFTANDTWTVPAGVHRARIRAWGGGGGGQSAAVVGGGGGEYAEEVVNVIPGEAHTVTIGAGGAIANAGGNTSVGSLITANGGGAGSGSGGSGGTGGGAAFSISGQVGRSGGTYEGQQGGSSPMGGFGGREQGEAGTAPGGGGGGNAAGAAGRVIIEY